MKHIYAWDTQASAACAAVREYRQTLRVVLKTKDEVELLEKWIWHYLSLLGDSARIIVLDNLSSHPAVLECYEKYAPWLIVVFFHGDQDRVHDASPFLPLYEAIWASSLFYTIVDTDEFLCLYDGYRLIQDTRVLAYLKKSQGVTFFTPHWLPNNYFQEHTFVFQDDPNLIFHNMLYGKPILNSQLVQRKIPPTKRILHTADLPVTVHEGHSPACFLLLHRKDISKTRRIRVNMDKLVSSGFIRDRDDFASVLQVDMKTIPNATTRTYIQELYSIIGGQDRDEDDPIIAPGHFVAHEDGRLTFYPPELEKIFQRYVNCRLSFFDLNSNDRYV